MPEISILTIRIRPVQQHCYHSIQRNYSTIITQIKGQNVLIFSVNKKTSRRHREKTNRDWLIGKIKVRWINWGKSLFLWPRHQYCGNEFRNGVLMWIDRWLIYFNLNLYRWRLQAHEIHLTTRWGNNISGRPEAVQRFSSIRIRLFCSKRLSLLKEYLYKSI